MARLLLLNIFWLNLGDFVRFLAPEHLSVVGCTQPDFHLWGSAVIKYQAIYKRFTLLIVWKEYRRV